jgi:HD-GYP domain-containing protein (c-di-GMP phosphodiesterase class II)
MSEQENRVGQYARRVGEILGLEPETLLMLELAGSLHDVGKDMLSRRIVEKPGPLSDAEWEAMRRHPELGEAVAREEGHPDDVGDWVRHHHERLDGTGYPDSLHGEEIPIGARIIAVLDAYVGMTSPRPYRPPIPAQVALEELEHASGKHFDPEVVDVFVRLVRANLPGGS